MPYVIEIREPRTRRLRGYVTADAIQIGPKGRASVFPDWKAAADVAGECAANGDGLIVTRVVALAPPRSAPRTSTLARCPHGLGGLCPTCND